jgi:transposase
MPHMFNERARNPADIHYCISAISRRPSQGESRIVMVEGVGEIIVQMTMTLSIKGCWTVVSTNVVKIASHAGAGVMHPYVLRSRQPEPWPLDRQEDRVW